MFHAAEPWDPLFGGKKPGSARFSQRNLLGRSFVLRDTYFVLTSLGLEP